MKTFYPQIDQKKKPKQTHLENPAKTNPADKPRIQRKETPLTLTNKTFSCLAT
jgi:hypothetical protein